MKITQISVYHVDLPLEHPYWLSGGRLKFEVLDATLVKIETDNGGGFPFWDPEFEWSVFKVTV